MTSRLTRFLEGSVLAAIGRSPATAPTSAFERFLRSRHGETSSCSVSPSGSSLPHRGRRRPPTATAALRLAVALSVCAEQGLEEKDDRQGTSFSPRSGRRPPLLRSTSRSSRPLAGVGCRFACATASLSCLNMGLRVSGCALNTAQFDGVRALRGPAPQGAGCLTFLANRQASRSVYARMGLYPRRWAAFRQHGGALRRAVERLAVRRGRARRPSPHPATPTARASRRGAMGRPAAHGSPAVETTARYSHSTDEARERSPRGPGDLSP